MNHRQIPQLSEAQARAHLIYQAMKTHTGLDMTRVEILDYVLGRWSHFAYLFEMTADPTGRMTTRDPFGAAMRAARKLAGEKGETISRSRRSGKMQVYVHANKDAADDRPVQAIAQAVDAIHGSIYELAKDCARLKLQLANDPAALAELAPVEEALDELAALNPHFDELED